MTSSVTNLNRRQRAWALLSASVVLLCAFAALRPAAVRAQSTASDLAAIQIPTVPPTEGPIHTILMFPFVNAIPADAPANGFDGTIVGARMENAVKMRLNEIGRYKADSFSPTLPQIQRAVQDSGLDGLTETDVAPPYDTAQKGRKLADQIATDGYLLGTIESLQTDPQTRTVSLTITATLYSTETGAAVKALAYTGRGVSFNTTDDPAALLQSAVNDAAGHVVSALNADVSQGRFVARPDVGPRHRSKAGEIALGLLVAAAVAIGITAAHHSSHSSSGTTTTTTTTTTTGTGGILSPPGVPIGIEGQ